MLKAILRAVVCCLAIPGPALLAAVPDSVPFDRPLVFEPNLGQAPAQVSWTGRGQGYQLYLTASGASIVVAEPVTPPPVNRTSPDRTGIQTAGLLRARVSVVGMNLGGSRPWDAVEGLEPTGGTSNYLLGKDPKDW